MQEKKKPGRPPMPPSKLKSVPLCLRVDPEKALEIRRGAAAAGVGVIEFIRRMVNLGLSVSAARRDWRED